MKHERLGLKLKSISREFFNSEGLCHRENGPAYEDILFGFTQYCINGKIHRLDGPAKIWSNNAVGR